MFSYFLGNKKTKGKDKLENALWYAAKTGDVESVKKLLDNGDDPNEGAEDAWKPELDPKKNIRSFPIVQAAANGHFEVVELLMEQCKLDPTSIVTAIEVALRNDHQSIVNYLLGKYHINSKANMGNISELDADGNTMLHYFIEHIANASFKFNQKTDNAYHPSDIEITSYDEENFQFTLYKIYQLIQMGADINAYNKHGLTPLLLATGKSGRDSYKTPAKEALHLRIFPIVIKALLDQGADANKLSRWSFESPLVVAAQVGNSEAVKLLLPYTTREDYKIWGISGFGDNTKYVQIGQEPWYVKPMFSALGNGNESVTNILGLLKEAGADFNYKVTDEKLEGVNTTAATQYLLEYAVNQISPRYGEPSKDRDGYSKKEFDIDIATIRFLLENGSDPTLIRANGQSPLAFYQPNGYFSDNEKSLVLGLLVQYGYRFTPMVKAEVYDQKTTMRSLLI